MLHSNDTRPRFPLLSLLREELADRPGRLAAAARIAGSCTVVVAIGMLYQIPLTAYMAYIVFLISREEAASTVLTGVVGAFAATFAIVLSLFFYTLDASEPALRLPIMAISAFAGMFMVRTMAIGPVGFLAGFVLVLSQTLIDEIPTLEGLTRFVLWLWVVVLVPVTVTLLVNLAIGVQPGWLARRTARRLLRAVAAILREGGGEKLARLRAEAIGLLELRQRAAMFDHDLRPLASVDTRLIGTLAEILTMLELLPPDTPLAARLPLAQACDAAIAVFDGGRAETPAPDETVLDTLSPAARPVVAALAGALARLTDDMARRRERAGQKAAPAEKSAFVPDAFTNPGHVRFALKTTIAVMAAYVIYSGLDWPGISTSITTCFFVALGSLGETMHKLTLRLTGALIGGLVGGLCIVYVLPAMTDIGQLGLLIGLVSLLAAWVATSSDRLAYAGMQMAFAFFLGVLQGYGPSTDLTVLRDRVVGILLGNLLMSLVFSTLWPVSVGDQVRSGLAAALRALGRLLGADGPATAEARLGVVRALNQAQRFVSLTGFELRMLPDRTPRRQVGEKLLSSLSRLAGAVFVVIGQPADARRGDEGLSLWFARCASALSAGEPTPPAPPVQPSEGDAVALLTAEIEHAHAIS